MMNAADARALMKNCTSLDNYPDVIALIKRSARGNRPSCDYHFHDDQIPIVGPLMAAVRAKDMKCRLIVRYWPWYGKPREQLITVDDLPKFKRGRCHHTDLILRIVWAEELLPSALYWVK